MPFEGEKSDVGWEYVNSERNNDFSAEEDYSSITCDQASLIFFVAAERYAYLSAVIKNVRDA